MPPRSSLLLALALAGMAGGCTDYLERRDTLALHAGDSAAANRAIHTIDPWPAASRDTAIAHDGVRVARAIERYRTRGDEGPAAPMIQIPVGAPRAP